MEEEVDLREYINVLLKWKTLIIGITVVAMLVAGILSYFVMKPVYEGSAEVILPAVNGKQFPSCYDVQGLLKSSSFASIISKSTNIPYEEIISGMNVSVMPKTNFIKVTFESSDRSKINSFFNSLITALNEKYKDFFDSEINAIKLKLSIFEKRINSLDKREKDILPIMRKIGSYNVRAEYLPTYALLLTLQDSIDEAKMSTEQQIIDLKSSLEMSHGFTYLEKPVVPTHPIKPKKLFNIAVSGVAAFFFAVLLAFFLEYWNGEKEEDKKEPV